MVLLCLRGVKHLGHQYVYCYSGDFAPFLSSSFLSSSFLVLSSAFSSFGFIIIFGDILQFFIGNIAYII